LHEALGLSEAVGVELMARMEKNQENKDSMRVIISESLGSLEEYLRDNEQIDLAGMILAGGVIEALYIATQLVDMNAPQETIAQLIADQKHSLQSLHELFESYATNENIAFYINDIRKIWSIYEQMPEVKIESAGSTDGDMMVIGANKKIEITGQQIAALKTVVQEIRNNYIKI
jgi:tRNA-dihydrouridine synthase